MRPEVVLVAAENKRPDREDERLDAQQQGVHQTNSIDGVERHFAAR